MNAVRKVKPQARQRTASFRECTCGYAFNASITICPKCKVPIDAPAAAPRAKPKHYEDAHQAALFRWAEFANVRYPDLSMLYHVPNGGARNPIEGKRLKAQGVKAGVLDINLDVPRGTLHGLRIELKATRAELGCAPPVSDEQKDWIARFTAQGYRAVVCEGWEQARDAIEGYLAIEAIKRLSP